MKKTLVSVLAAFFVWLIALQSACTASTAGYGYQIDVSNTSFQPSTIYAGDIVTLKIDLKNRGANTTVTNLHAVLDFGDQFNVIKGSDSLVSINPNTTKTIELQFQVKTGTPSGYYSVPLTITYMLGNDLLEQDHVIFVPVSKVEKNLDITIRPSVINPSKPTKVVFTLKNVSNTPVSNISFFWSEPNNLILPLGSDNKRHVDVLPANSDVNISYIIAADPNITPGIYPLSINTTFNDTNATRTQTSLIGLIIGGMTDFEVSAEISSTNQLSVSIANIGSNNASAVVVKIPKQKGVTVNGSNISILGNLNRGDYTIASFELQSALWRQASPSSGRPIGMPLSVPGQFIRDTNALQLGSENTIIIEIDYTDTTGERQSIQKTILLSTLSSDTSSIAATSFRQRNSQQLPIIPWATLALLAVGAVVFNKFKAKKGWKKLAIVLVLIVAMFIAVISLLGSDLFAVGVATIVSLLLLVRLFRKGLLTTTVEKIEAKIKAVVKLKE